MSQYRLARTLLFVTLFFVGLSAHLEGQTYTGPDNGLWSDDSHWDTGLAPVSGAANLTITYAAGTSISTTQDISSPFELQSFVLAGNGSFAIDGSGGLLRFRNLGAAPTIEKQTNRQLDIFSLVEFADTLTINSAVASRQYFRNQVSGAGGLTLNGDSTTYLEGSTNNTFSGLTTVNEQSTLWLQKTNATALAGDLHVFGGTANIAGSGFDQINDASTVTVESTAASAAALTMFKSETIGNLVMKSSDSQAATIGSASTSSLIISGNVEVQANLTGNAEARIITTALDLDGGIRTFDVADGSASNDLNVFSAITNGGINKTGDGTMFLQGANTYSGGTTVSAGVLRGALRGIQGDIVNNSEVSLYLGGTYSGNMSGSGVLTIEGSEVTLAGNNSFTGGIEYSGRVIGDTNSLTTNINGGGVVEFDQATDGTFSKVISGTGRLIKDLGGALTLGANNTHTGITEIKGGTLRFGVAEALPTGKKVTIAAGANLDLNNFETTIIGLSGEGNIQLGSANLNVNSAPATGGLDGVISGTGSLTKIGNRTWTLTGAQTYSGGTFVEEGSLSFNGDERLLDTGEITITGGVLQLNSAMETVGDINLIAGNIGGSGTLIGSAYNFQSGDVRPDLAGTSGLIKTTSGTASLSGTNSYTGDTVINEGTLRVTGGGLAVTGQVIVDGGAFTSNHTETIGDLHLIDGVVGTFGGGTLIATEYDLRSGIVRMSLAGTEMVTKTTAGTVVLNGPNSYSGGTLVSAGILSGTWADSLQGDIENNALVRFSAAHDYSGNLSGTGSVEIIDGDVSFTGINNYTGGTTVENGSLAIGSNSAIGTGSLALEDDATISATGAARLINNATTVNGSVTFAGTENLTLSNVAPITIVNGETLHSSNTATTTVAGEINGQTGSILSATAGSFVVGDGSSVTGFFSDGELNVNANTVTVNDANEAVLGSINRLGNGTDGGTLTAGTALASDTRVHLLVEAGKSVTGHGNINGNFKNQGDVTGNGTAANERIVFGADWTVNGIGDFNNTLVLGTFGPGESPGISTGSDQAFGGTLEFELGGLTPGFGSNNHDQIIDDGMISLMNDPTITVLSFNAFLPDFGDEFLVMTWNNGLDGSFGPLDVDPFFTSNGINFEAVLSGVNGAGGLTLRVTPVPEPGACLLLLLTLCGLSTVRRR